MANCMFLRRRYKNAVIPTVLELFSDMSVIACAGSTQSSTTNVMMYNSRIPTTGTCYMFSFCNGYVGIWKFVNGVINETAIKRTVPSNVSIKYGCLFHNTTSNNNRWCYANGAAVTSGTSGSGTDVYGATILLAQFPSYSADVVDYVLSNAIYTRKGGRNSSTDDQTNITSHTNEMYLICSAATCSAWKDEGSGSTPPYSIISGTTSTSGYVSDNRYLRSSYTYGYSFIAVDSPVT